VAADRRSLRPTAAKEELHERIEEMTMKYLRFALPLALLLAACAPAVSGSSVRDALVVRGGETVELERGREYFLRLDFTLADFGIQPSSLSGSFWIPAGVNEESASLSTRFAMRQPRVPFGWMLELADVRGYRTTETRYGRETGEVSYRISPVLHLRIPEDAELGVSTLRAEMAMRGGTPRNVELQVRVRAARNR
jgi:hypothetical protein